MRLSGRRPATAVAVLASAVLVVSSVTYGLSKNVANGSSVTETSAASSSAASASPTAPRGRGSLGPRSRVSAKPSTGAKPRPATASPSHRGRQWPRPRPRVTPTPRPTSSPTQSPTTKPNPDVTDRTAGGFAAGGAEPWNTRRAADYAAMRAAGLTWMRTDFDWMQIEGQKGRWDVPLYDATVADAKKAGLQTLAILHTVPDWANGAAGVHAPPADPALMTEFCYRTLQHYLPLGVTTYEIGNEVNLPASGRPKPDGATYANKFLLPCVAGVRKAEAATGVDATILLGSLVPAEEREIAPDKFLTDVYAAAGNAQFDAVALHPYTGADAPTISQNLTKVPDRLFEVMKAHGDGGLRIWATEFGYPTAGLYSVSESDQGKYVVPALKAWFEHAYTGPLFWYCPRDNGQNRGEREDHFGILHADGSPKPAYNAIKAWYTG